MHGLLEDIGIAVVAATAIGVVTHRLRQPIILGYLVAGACIGPELGLGLVSAPESIEVISEIGLILLLFVIGLELDVARIARAGTQLLAAGVGQFVLCAALGLGVFALAGYPIWGERLDGTYLAVLSALSSTAIVAKLMQDRQEVDTIPGRLTLGILVIQDLWVILILAVQPNLADPSLAALGAALGWTVTLLVSGFVLSKYVLGHVYRTIALSPEMVVGVSLGWCAVVAGAAGAMGLSRAMGALVAGVSISAFPYSAHVTEKVQPLRDFFLTLFFVSLGMKILAPGPGAGLTTLLVVAVVMLSRFLTVWPILRWTGAGRRAGFVTSLNIAQLSEFSLVIAALGVELGHVDKGVLTTLIYVMAVTSVASSYMITYSHAIYLAVDRLAGAIGLGRCGDADAARCEGEAHPVVILGFHRGARALADLVAKRSPQLLGRLMVVDFNPEVLKRLRGAGIAGVYGDVASHADLERAGVGEARVVLSTIPDALLKGTSNLRLVESCRRLAPKATIVATAEGVEDAEALRRAGADEVLVPHAISAERLVDLLDKTFAATAGASLE